MRPHQHVRTAKGYCCIWCDGPYSGWKKRIKRSQKRTDKLLAKKQMERDLNEGQD